MRIGQLAESVGVNASTIRYYEQIGLLRPPQRTASGYRTYTEADERRLRLVVQARMLSLPLDEIGQFVDIALDGRCGTARTELLSALRHRLSETRRQIRELKSLQRELERTCAHLASGSEPAPEDLSDSCTCLEGPSSSSRAEGKGSEGDDRREDRT